MDRPNFSSFVRFYYARIQRTVWAYLSIRLSSLAPEPNGTEISAGDDLMFRSCLDVTKLLVKSNQRLSSNQNRQYIMCSNNRL